MTSLTMSHYDDTAEDPKEYFSPDHVTQFYILTLD